MIGNFIVADATVHGYNWSRENWAIPEAAASTAGGYGLHQLLTRDESMSLTEEEFIRDWTPDDVIDAVFRETATDLLCHHGTPIWDFYRDGHSDTEKGYEIRDRHPNRTLVYGAINPFHGDRVFDEIDYLVEEKKVNGLKIYAARYHDGITYPHRLDDPEFGYPFIQHALDRGVKVIATHKAIPFGPVRAEPYNVDDVPEVLSAFPKMNFEVVHAGWAFVEDTAFLGGFPNCWFNLETCFALINRAPRRFAEFMAALLASGAEDRIIYSSGALIAHPRAALEAFTSFEMPEDLVEGHAIPPMTDDLKRKILGLNFMRLHDIDPNEFQQRIAGDDISLAQSEGLRAPWSGFRSRLGVAA